MTSHVVYYNVTNHWRLRHVRTTSPLCMCCAMTSWRNDVVKQHNDVTTLQRWRHRLIHFARGRRQSPIQHKRRSDVSEACWHCDVIAPASTIDVAARGSLSRPLTSSRHTRGRHSPKSQHKLRHRVATLSRRRG